MNKGSNNEMMAMISKRNANNRLVLPCKKHSARYAPNDQLNQYAKGDAVKIDFVGSVDGTEFPGGTAQDYVLEIGSGSFIPGFEDQLVGAEAGKTVEVKVTFPKEYGAAELAGKDAQLRRVRAESA